MQRVEGYKRDVRCHGSEGTQERDICVATVEPLEK